MGLTNLKAMIPFCRTIEEGKKVLAEMEKYGLKRGRAFKFMSCAKFPQM